MEGYKIFKKKVKCPNCGSTKTSINELSEFYCKKCGYIHSNIKRACFVDFCNL